MKEVILDSVQSVNLGWDFTNRSRNAEAYFTGRLGEVLTTKGYISRREVPYCGSQCRCDLLAQGTASVGLEVKLLFPAYWKSNPRDRQRLFGPLMDAGEWGSHSVANDLEKLSRMRLALSPDYLGILVVASCTDRYHLRSDFQRFSEMAGLKAPWICGAAEFANAFWEGYFLDARVWLCPSGEIELWWNRVRERYEFQ